MTPTSNGPCKRPTNEPPPPPLPKSPPPISPVKPNHELDNLFDNISIETTSSNGTTTSGTSNGTTSGISNWYSSRSNSLINNKIDFDDEYLPPIRPNEMTGNEADNRKQSTTTLSSINSKDYDSINCGSSSPSSASISSGISSASRLSLSRLSLSRLSLTNLMLSPSTDEYDSNFFNKKLQNQDDNYEIVDDINEKNDINHNNNDIQSKMMQIQRPLLPKIKENQDFGSTSSGINNILKLKPEISLTAIANWSKIVMEKKFRDKQIEIMEHQNGNIQNGNGNIIHQRQNSDEISNSSNESYNSTLQNHNTKHLSISHSTRPLPPLPPLSPLPPFPSSPQKDNFTNEYRLDHDDKETIESLKLFDWFHDVQREEAEEMLKRINEDGSYLVRESRRAGKSNPFTLTIFQDKRLFHLNIRLRIDGLYSLGKEKQREKVM